MVVSRRFLPAIPQLLAFEATARLGSATAAGQELAQTQSGISRNIRQLEEQIGVTLFRRAGRKLALTAEGAAYAEDVRQILARLGRATEAARQGAKGDGPLNLAILPAFGMHWLAPRLAGFARAHPGITVNLSTRLAPFDFRAVPFDAAIHFGRRDWPGVAYLPLMPETVVAVCAPALTRDAPLAPEELAQLPLLHLETRPRAWARWFDAQGCAPDLPPGMMFDQFSTMAQAAVNGLGVALIPDFVAAPHVDRRELVVAATARGQSIGHYYLVWPHDRADRTNLARFRDWLAEEIGLPSE